MGIQTENLAPIFTVGKTCFRIFMEATMKEFM